MQQYDLVALRSFITVVDAGSFNQAAQLLSASTAAISRRVSGLESALGVRLLNRTTRSIDLTESGQQFYHDIINVLSSLEEAQERIQQGRKIIKGTLRIACGLSFGTNCLSPILPNFMKQHPELEVQLRLDDQVTDLVAESIDVALRIGVLKDSSLVATRISEIPFTFCASPAYLAQHGIPQVPEDLISHNCLRYNAIGTGSNYDFCRDGIQQQVNISGSLSANNGQVLRDAAINDVGITLLPNFIGRQAIADGRLQVILADYAPQTYCLYAVKLSRKYTPAKVTALIDYLKASFADLSDN